MRRVASYTFVAKRLDGWRHHLVGSRHRRRPRRIRRVLSAPRKGHSTAQHPLSFRPMSVVATVAHLSYCWALVFCDTVFMFTVYSDGFFECHVKIMLTFGPNLTDVIFAAFLGLGPDIYTSSTDNDIIISENHQRLVIGRYVCVNV